MEWKNNKLGISDKVPQPWTPLEILNKSNNKQLSIACWGRKYSFDNSLFPSQILTRSKEILASPISFTAKVDGKDVKLSNFQSKLIRETPTKVDFATSSNNKKFNITTDSYIEFDGMIYFNVLIDPVKTATVDRLTLKIPFRGEFAKFLSMGNNTKDESGSYNEIIGRAVGRIGSAPDWKWECKFPYYFWVGDDYRGLTWFSESTRGWSLTPGTKPIKFYRDGDKVICEIVIINKPKKLNAPLKIAFGIHATPVKPLPRGWRSLLVHRRELAVHWYTNKGASKYPAYPEASDLNYVKKVIDKRYHKRNLAVVPYIHPVLLFSGSPEYKYFHKYWEMPNVKPSYRGNVWGGMCPSIKEHNDWLVYKACKFIKEAGWDGIYYDHTWPWACLSTEHGCRGKMPILGYRELYKRLYIAIKGLNKSNWIMGHISTPPPCTPFASFMDAQWVGEEFNSARLNNDGYLSVMSLDYYRAGMTGRQFGWIPQWLQMPHKTGDSLVTEMGAIAFLHDAPGQNDKNNIVTKPVYKVYDKFGIITEDDVEFLPYWNNKEYVTATFTSDYKVAKGDKYPAPFVSIYRRKGKGCIFIVSNLSERNGKIKLNINYKALGFDVNKLTVTDSFTNRRIENKTEPVILVGSKNLKLITAEYK